MEKQVYKNKKIVAKKISTERKLFYKLSSSFALPIPKKVIEEFNFKIENYRGKNEPENILKVLSFEKQAVFYSVEFFNENDELIIKIKKLDLKRFDLNE